MNSIIAMKILTLCVVTLVLAETRTIKILKVKLFEEILRIHSQCNNGYIAEQLQMAASSDLIRLWQHNSTA